MGPLESRIDDLYRLPLGQFVSARSALAKSLAGAEAQRVRKLAKPTVVPWAVNQVYWRARPLYERVMKSGEQLRHTQVAALEGKLEGKKDGKRTDVRSATDAHRRAIAEAVQQAELFAAAEESRPGVDELMRTFEALSLSSLSSPQRDAPGRLVRPLRPAGFEALAGVKLKANPAAALRADAQSPAAARVRLDERTPRNKRASKKEEAARKKREAALERVKRAEAEVERAKRRMLEAQEMLRRTRDPVS